MPKDKEKEKEKDRERAAAAAAKAQLAAHGQIRCASRGRGGWNSYGRCVSFALLSRAVLIC